MAKITKPNMSNLWAEAGAIIAPSGAKVQQGWTAEIPPHQWENYVQNRQDTYLAYLGQQGVPEWDSTTEYQADTSYVQYDGKTYLARVTNTNTQPDTNPSEWVRWAFAADEVLTTSTPPQFDNTTKIATTEFVQRALGNLRGGVSTPSTTRTLNADDVGQILIFSNAAVGAGSWTLSQISTLKEGSTFSLINNSSHNLTITRSGSDVIWVGLGANQNSITLPPQTSVVLSANTATWYVTGGTFQLKNSPGFNSSLGTSGWQVFPSGLVIMWGTDTVAATDTLYTKNLPVAFGTNFYSIVASDSNPTTAGAVAATPNGLGQYDVKMTPGSGGFSYIAFGRNAS